MAVPGKKASDKFSTTMSRGSGEDFELFCQPCDRDDVRLPAVGYCVDCEEHLCESCFTTHRRPKPSRHHKLLDQKSMPKVQQLSTSTHPTGQSLTKPCPKHHQEMLKYYCHSHKAVICNVCVTLEHTVTTCKVNYIPDISKQALNSNEYRDTLQNIDKITERCKKLVLDLQKVTHTSNSSLTDVLADVQKFRKEINQSLDELEKKVTGAVNEEQLQNKTRLKRAETTFDDVIKALQTSANAIKQLNISQQADQLFVELKSAKQRIEHDDDEILKLLSSDVKEYHFSPNQALSYCIQKETSLGAITEKILKATSSPPRWNPSFQRKISVKTSEDKLTQCWITGMTLLNSNQLVLADADNDSVKMLDTSQRSITDQLHLDCPPWDVTSVTNNQLAVTLPRDHSIQFVSVSSSKFRKAHKLKVDGTCKGIGYCRGKLAVSFDSPEKLQVINLKGNILMSVTNDSAGEFAFKYPQYVKCNMDSIYVSDSYQNTMFKFNWQGGMIGEYQNMNFPLGLAMLDDGSLLASEAKANSIQLVSDDLAKGEVVLKNLTFPRALSWCNQNKVLYISSSKSDKKTDNFIQVYRML